MIYIMRKSSLKHETQLELIKCKSSSRGQEADELSHIRGRITQSSRSFFIFILKVWAVTQNSVGKQNSQITVNQSSNRIQVKLLSNQ